MVTIYILSAMKAASDRRWQVAETMLSLALGYANGSKDPRKGKILAALSYVRRVPR